MPATLFSELDQLIKQLEQLDAILADLVSQDVLERSQQLVPVRTGTLKASGRREVDGKRWRVIYDAPYAAHVEYGTTKQAARPFLHPALEAVDWDALVRQALKQAGF